MKVTGIDFGSYKKDNKVWTDKLLQHGIYHVECAAVNLPESAADKDELITYALSQGLAINIHAPYGENNITSTDRERRASSIANVKASIDLAAKYGLGVVTFHPGRLSQETDDPEEIWADLMEVVSDIAQYAKEKQVYVGMENMELRPYELVFTVDDLNRFAPLGENNPYFGVTIDFAHYVTLGIGLPDLQTLKLPLHNVHLSQVRDGRPHFSLTYTDGQVDVDSICRQLADYSYAGTIVLEHGTPLWESLEMLKAAIEAV